MCMFMFMRKFVRAYDLVRVCVLAGACLGVRVGLCVSVCG